MVHSYACQTLSTRLLLLPTDNGRVKLPRTPILFLGLCVDTLFCSSEEFVSDSCFVSLFLLCLLRRAPAPPAPFTRPPHSLLRHGEELYTDTRHVLSTSLARHTYPLARSHTRTRTHARSSTHTTHHNGLNIATMAALAGREHWPEVRGGSEQQSSWICSMHATSAIAQTVH